jgi:hypothetical protein
MARNFDEWLSTFTDNINRYNYYVNFDTVYRNTTATKRYLALFDTLKISNNIAVITNVPVIISLFFKLTFINYFTPIDTIIYFSSFFVYL